MSGLRIQSQTFSRREKSKYKIKMERVLDKTRTLLFALE